MELQAWFIEMCFVRELMAFVILAWPMSSMHPNQSLSADVRIDFVMIEPQLCNSKSTNKTRLFAFDSISGLRLKILDCGAFEYVCKYWINNIIIV